MRLTEKKKQELKAQRDKIKAIITELVTALNDSEYHLVENESNENIELVHDSIESVDMSDADTVNSRRVVTEDNVDYVDWTELSIQHLNTYQLYTIPPAIRKKRK